MAAVVTHKVPVSKQTPLGGVVSSFLPSGQVITNEDADRRTLSLYRQGDFTIKSVGPNHCGVDEKINIKYEMTCECDSTLDSRGFLFEQRNVDAFFKGIIETTASCEQLAMWCVDRLRAAIKTENPVCVVKRMVLTLMPAPYQASITYKWVQ